MFDVCRHAIAASRALEDGVDPACPATERGTAGSRIDFRHAFWLATTGGGEALDLPIGKFAPGYQFDAVAIDAGAPGSNIVIWDDIDTIEDVFQKIVYAATRSDIAGVWVAGRKCLN